MAGNSMQARRPDPVRHAPLTPVAARTESAVHPPQHGSEPQERWIRVVATITLVYSLGYIIWRWGFTLNPQALWFAVPLVVAETYGLATLFFMTFTAWRLERRQAPVAPAGRTVDVFITCYDEPLTVIRKTVLAAREILYAHRTWVLDDGKRDELRRLAEELGVDYLRRETNEHAKAGNLNHALRHSEGEFILQLDADHVPLPHILDRLLGFLADPAVAFAQSPQDFYNTDAFTYEVNESARRIWEDQQLFFRVIQPGKDRFGAAFFVGSCAVIRRSALEDIGGFATRTITEDIETSLLLHSRGWKSVFYAETLAYGLAPGSAAAFHTQHLRWGQGAMQVMRHYRPLTRPGLTPAQRLGYFDSLTTYLSGFQRLIFYLAPPVFFFTGVFPVRASAGEFLLIFVPYLLLQMLSFKLLARGHGSLLLADRYGMAKFFTHIMGVAAYFTRGRLRFTVTPKGITGVPLRTYAPQLVLATVSLLAVVWAAVALSVGRVDYAVPGWGSLAFWVNFMFAGWNITAAVFIVEMSLRLRQKRHEHRYPGDLPVHVRTLREGRGVREHAVGVSQDLNPAGVALRMMQPIDSGSWVEVELPLVSGVVQAKGRIVNRRTADSRYGTVHIHGVEFVSLPWPDRDAIELHCAHHVAPRRRERYRAHPYRVGTVLQRGLETRRAPRERVGMPARVIEQTADGDRFIGIGLWEDTSAIGARIIVNEAVPRDRRLRVEIPGTGSVAEGTVVFVRAIDAAEPGRFLIGLRRDRAPPAAVPPRLLPAARAGIGRAAGIAANWAGLGAAAAAHVALRGAREAGRRIGIDTQVAPDLNEIPEPPRAARPEPETENGESTMVQDPSLREQPAAEEPTPPPIVTIWGGVARLHGTFEIEDSIEVSCHLSGELTVGGRLVIAEGGNVDAIVHVHDAVIRGSYEGDLVATGTVHIAPGGRVNGTLQTDELIVERGGSLSGSVARVSENAAEPAAAQPGDVSGTPAPGEPPDTGRVEDRGAAMAEGTGTGGSESGENGGQAAASAAGPRGASGATTDRDSRRSTART